MALTPNLFFDAEFDSILQKHYPSQNLPELEPLYPDESAHRLLTSTSEPKTPASLKLVFLPGTDPMVSNKEFFGEDPDSEVFEVLMPFKVQLQNALLIHRNVVETVRREQQVENAFCASEADGTFCIPRLRRRRKPRESEWKPESVYKTYVDCKPVFFDKSNYQDHVPHTSCFGKINMRIPKAWSRGPNKPKKRKRQTLRAEVPPAAHTTPLKSANLSHFSPLYLSQAQPVVELRQGFPHPSHGMNYAMNNSFAAAAPDFTGWNQMLQHQAFFPDPTVGSELAPATRNVDERAVDQLMDDLLNNS